jgi:hypothetical protein
MNMKKIISILTILAMVFALAACGNKNEGGEEDGQNPVMNYIGDYVCDRADISIEAQGTNEAKVIVTWGSSAWESAEWVMSGVFDDEALLIEYHDCVKNVTTFDEDGEIKDVEEVYTGGHGTLNFAEDGTLTWTDDQEKIADGMTFTFMSPEEAAEAEESEEGEQQTGMANPWSEASSLEEANEGAGIDPMTFAEGMEISLGELNVESYRYMDEMVELIIPVAAVDMTIRKGTSKWVMNEGDGAEECGDISGDYNKYKYNWTQNIKGLEVYCYGNREGESTKTIWNVEDNYYSITAYGAGGDEDFGLNPDDINSIVNGLQ